MSPYFDRLPDEIISSIILLLPVVDILSCRSLFVRFNAIIQTDPAIQYKIELAANGFVACPDSTLPAATSLSMLREQQDAWRRCEWKEEQVHVVQLRSGECPYKCRNGVLAIGRNGLPPSPAGLLSDNATGITCLKVASATTCKGANEETIQWPLDGLGISFRDFAIDPLIDLLVLVERNTNNIYRLTFPFRIHILKLSDGQPHEMAANHVLDLRMKDVSAPQYCGISVKLHGTYAGVLVQDGNAEDYDCLTIWNWRTGEQELIEAPMFTYEDFSFIDTRSVMLAVNGYPSALQVWYFDRSNVFHVGSFALPHPTHDYNSMHFDGGPRLSLGDAKTLDGAPFALSPESDVLAITLEGDLDPSLEDEFSTFTMVMRPSLMFDALGVRPCDRVESFERLHVGCSPNSVAFSNILDWGEWGPESTRWIPQKLGCGRWDQHLVGGRFAVVTSARSADDVEPVRLSSSSNVIRLHDFRPEIVSRYARSFPQNICTDTSVIPKGTVFIEDVISRLPYHAVTSKELPHNMSRVMIDDGRLICTKEEPEFHALIFQF